MTAGLNMPKVSSEPEADVHFHEEDFPIVLSARDARAFVEALQNPPEPNAAALRAALRFREWEKRQQMKK